MSTLTLRESILSKYEPTVSEISKDIFLRSRRSYIKGATLDEFYREIFAKYHTNPSYDFLNQNAAEIERMMKETRKLIESKRRTKK
ncbi:MAG: hypothetical protein AB7S65_00935 [Sulfuricurvum sp.]